MAEMLRVFEANKRTGRGLPEILRKHARYGEVSKTMMADVIIIRE